MTRNAERVLIFGLGSLVFTVAKEATTRILGRSTLDPTYRKEHRP